MRLTLFDLDHTLLDGDSDQLWCQFLIDRGVLDRAGFAARNDAMARGYAEGHVTPAEFCAFYVGTLAGRSAEQWRTVRDACFAERVVPRFAAAARALVARHRDAGDLVVLTTATCSFLAEPSAAHLGFEHLIATQAETDAEGRFTGRVLGTPNMREGKVARLHAWLAARGTTLAEHDSTLYSDSINDLPLLQAVRRAVVVHPDARLAAEAAARGWAAIDLR